MFGYAVNETPEFMPLSISMSHRLTYELAQMRKRNAVKFLRPDSKSQVTVEYKEGKASRIDTVVLSTQHSPDVDQKQIREFIIEELVPKAIPSTWIDSKTKFHINPTGRFVVGGPQGDCGLTGRKIIVDTYGGHGAHGGGAFSGKDPSKVDRSAAYAARHVAKNIVAAGLAERCLVQLAYAIGVAEPVSIMVNDFGTSKVGGEVLSKAVRHVWNLKPAAIIQQFDLLKPRYRKSCNYGHFGRELPELTWERLDKVAAVQDAVATLKKA
jgi:S-adenosylmethionine synthetase